MTPGENVTPTGDDTRYAELPDLAATAALGARLAGVLRAGMVVWLEGDLGAGKTTLTRAILQGLGHQGPVKSPTYALVEVYKLSSLYLYHFDFYRFEHPSEFEEAGLDEYFRGDALCVVEWPDKASGHVPPPDLRIVLQWPAGGSDSHPEGGAGRRLWLIPQSEEGRRCLEALGSTHNDPNTTTTTPPQPNPGGAS